MFLGFTKYIYSWPFISIFASKIFAFILLSDMFFMICLPACVIQCYDNFIKWIVKESLFSVSLETVMCVVRIIWYS